MSNPEPRTRCQKLLQAALDQPNPTPELVAALRLFAPKSEASPKPTRKQTRRAERESGDGPQQRIVPLTNPGAEFCHRKNGKREWCRQPAGYYGQWLATNRNQRRVWFSRALCRAHAEEYALRYGLPIEKGEEVVS